MPSETPGLSVSLYFNTNVSYALEAGRRNGIVPYLKKRKEMIVCQ